MARYIDADKVMEEIERIGGHNLCEWETIGVKALIDRQPTADVAPKSEVAREIFAEMLEKLNHIVITADVDVEYNTFMKTINQVCSAVSAELAELKKKYTEGNNGQK